MKKILIMTLLFLVASLLYAENRCEPKSSNVSSDKKNVIKEYKDIVLAGMSKYYHIQDLPDNLKKDKDVALAAAHVSNIMLRHFDDTIKDDKEFVLVAISNQYKFFKEVSPRLKKDRDVVIAAIKKYGPAIQYADKSLRNDKELILMASPKLNFRVNILLSVFDKSLGEDKEFMRKVIKIQPRFAEIASKEHFKDKVFVLELLDAGIDSIASKIDSKLLKDKEIAYKLIKNRGYDFIYLDNSLKEDREIVTYALKEYMYNYKEIGEKLRNDKEIVKLVLSRDVTMLYHAGDEIKADKELVKGLMKSDVKVFSYASDILQDNEELATLAVSQDGYMFAYVSKRLQKDKKLATLAIEKNPNMLKFSDKSLLDDKDFVMMALLKKPSLYIYASKKLRNDPDILNIARQDPWVAYSLDTGEIEHKVKPMAWKQYTLENTLDELYGKDVKIIYDETLIDAKFDNRIVINSTIKAKSIAIIQERSQRTSLISLLYPQNESIKNLRISMKDDPANYPMEVYIVIEDLNGTLHKKRLEVTALQACVDDSFRSDSCTIKKYTKKRDRNIAGFKPKVRIKAKYRDGVVILKYMAKRAIDYDEAEEKNVSVEYISHIEVKNKDKVIYDMYHSQYIGGGYSRFTFQTTKVKKGDVLSLKIENIHGQTYTKMVTVK